MQQSIFYGTGVVLLTLLAACTGQPTCPPAPTPPDWGPLAAMNGQSSVDIELSQVYVMERIRKMMESPPSASSGAFIRSINLKEERGPNNQFVSVLELRLEPWLRGQDGQPASLQRSYRLKLKITPHIITPAGVPDPARRQQLLCPPSNPNCTATQGALLTFDLLELYNLSFSREACASPDVIDAQIVPVIYQSLAGQRPLLLPTESISAVLAGAGGGAANLVDVNVSADGFLKIGLQYDIAGTHAFDRVSQLLSRYPDRDWMVDIDKSILAAAVRARMQATLSARAAGSAITTFNTTFSPGEIRATGTATLPVPGICGSSTMLTIDARNPTQLCKDAMGNSVIVSWTDATTASGNFCVNFKKFWDNINVGTVSGPPTVWPTLATVTFPAGDDDTFYGTDLDLDNAFAIVGRSSLMDRKAADAGRPRAEIPGKCPGQ